ncbi:MAG: hypothetical protein KA195_09715, partial [Burkholderiaceae bacterium]|nr:hypothetical protein [Burkholderiaceae bacterium]
GNFSGLGQGEVVFAQDVDVGHGTLSVCRLGVERVNRILTLSRNMQKAEQKTGAACTFSI